MIPGLSVAERLPKAYEDFLKALAASEFGGEIRTDYATRLVTSTDNSIYQILPKAVLFPRTTEDVATILKLATRDAYAELTFSPRGGGTGTNGQSLCPGVIIDCSKYMRKVLEVNEKERWVRVQPGVIPDQLNRELAATGLFFAPDLSPSNRATIGGMINNDACGKGSRIYGRTSDHILETTLVLSDGEILTSGPITNDELAQHKQRQGCSGQVHEVVDQIVTDRKELIAETFPKMSRFLTGYDLAHVYDEDGDFNLHRIVCGSEGSLAIVTEARLNLIPIPKFKGLVAVKYSSFNDALADAMALLSTEPAAIETVDEKILAAARNDVIWNAVGPMLGDDPQLETVNLVEFVAHTNEEIEAKLALFTQDQNGRMGCYTTRDPKEIGALWALRKKGVGLLGNLPGVRRPIAFMEDTAVPPENLAAYIYDLRALLNQHGLQFAMYGHVDVGCLHVRPSLNMQDEIDEKLVRQLSDEVVALVRKYGGVMWAEHGKGFRSEYTPQFFGDILYQELRRIKAAFDPHNKLNPGKVVAPAGMPDDVVKVEAPLRGHFDRQVPGEWQEQFAPAINCNGNGACFNFDPHSVMCPSSKITTDRIHSPKGRAAMMREWLRRLAFTVAEPGQPIPAEGPFQAPEPGDMNRLRRKAAWPVRLKNTWFGSKDDFSHEVRQAMGGCLSCKACATQCPINVDIPDFKARFLDMYYARYLRKPRDLMVGFLENTLNLQASLPRLTNAVAGFPPVRALTAKLGLVDAPKLSTPTLRSEMKRRGISFVKPGNLPPADPNAVILVQDAFTCFYDCDVFWANYDLLAKLGFKPYIAPFIPNGKPLHIKGFLSEFKGVAQRNAQFHKALAATGIPLVSIEPGVALTYRDEYTKILETKDLGFEVHLLQEWLATKTGEFTIKAGNPKNYKLLAHCMEKTGLPGAESQWQQIFTALGLELEVLTAGCCGMAGTYGHESEHRANSEGIFKMSWGVHLDSGSENQILATGFSCRSQTKRFAAKHLKHPAMVLFEVL